MVKKLLLGAVICAALVPQMAYALEGKNSNNVKLVWKNSNLAAAVGTSRVYQGHVYNDKYYIMNGAENKVVIMNKDGKVGEIAAPNCWMNFGHDEAGNMILRQSDKFDGGFYVKEVMQWTMALLDPKTDKLTICKTQPDGYQNKYGGNNYAFGTAAGDVFAKTDETVSATMVVAPMYGGIDPIRFYGGDVENAGAHAGEWNWQYVEGKTGLPSEMIDPVSKRGASKVATTCVISTYSFYKKYDEDGFEKYLTEAAALNPYFDLTGESNGTGNSITHLINNGRDEHYWGGFYVTPGHNGMQGFEIFENGGKRYIVYTSGAENCDGFSIAEIDKNYDDYLRSTPESKPEDYKYLRATKGFDVDEDGDQLWTEPGKTVWAHINTFDVVPTDKDGVVYVYQYVPNAYIAKYEVDLLAGTGVSEALVDADDTKVYGSTGKITVIGGEVAIYTIDGKLVARTSESVNCAPGVYVAKTATKAVKVIVK